MTQSNPELDLQLLRQARINSRAPDHGLGLELLPINKITRLVLALLSCHIKYSDLNYAYVYTLVFNANS